MKILCLLTDGIASYGGIAQYNRDLVAGLSRSGGVESVWILARQGYAKTPDEPKVTRYPSVFNRGLFSARAFQLAWKLRPDVVFCGHLHLVPLAAVIARMFGARLWLQLHGIEAWTHDNRLVRWGAERATLVTAVSRYTRSRFLGWVRLDPARVKVLPNTFTPPIAPSLDRSVLRRKHGLEDRKVLITVSRLSRHDRYKGHERVLAVLPSLIAQVPALLYLIVGDGDDRARLEALAHSLGVAERVRFTGRVDGSALSELYRASDLFVMPSSKEGFGIVFLEAAAHGLALIAGNGDGSVDAMADGVLGALIDVARPEALAEAALAQMRNPSIPDPANLQRFAPSMFYAHLGELLGHLDSHVTGRLG